MKSLEVDKFELAFEKSSSLGIEINDGKLDHLSRSTDQGIAIRTLKNHRMGFAYTFDLSRNAVELAMRTALEIAELMPADPLNDLIPFTGLSYPKVENYDRQGLEVSLEQKIEIARGVEADAKRQDPRIKRVRKSSFNEARGESILLDSTGKQLRHEMTVFGASLTCVAEEDDDAEMGSDGRYSTKLANIMGSGAGEVAITAARNALEGLHAGQAPTMTCPVVLKNSVVADLLGFLSGSFSAESIDKNFSLLVGKKGEKLFSPKLTIVDDGLLTDGTSTQPFDGEGQPARLTTLVDGGVIANFIYDLYYARKHKTATTGNSSRGGVKSPPGVGTTNVYLKPGSRSFDMLVADAGKGVYITDLLGLHTANPVTGEFSVGASGVLIEGGRLTTPVKGFAIAGNLVDLLHDVADVGSDMRFWGSVGAPSLLVSKLAISGA
ncbi:MAG: TldD/PmbA family protein [Deltaproteobacteria bacterium]|nr:TldD/PmbA family protein [Deltaproteobacteria bacterium]